MLKIIFGRPRSGKTSKIISEIQASVKNKKKTYLIVPEQQVFVSESMLANLDPCAWQYLKVISFTGLCELVFAKYGGLTYKKVSDGAKHLLVWHTMRKLSDGLVKFSNIKIDPAFADMMLSAIDELSALGISSEEFNDKIQNAEDEEFKAKMQDLSSIYSSYKEIVANKFGNDDILLSDDILLRLSDVLEHNNFFANSDVYIDSFNDFTGIEFKILEKIIKGADLTTISISLPNGKSSEMHTHSANYTLNHLKKIEKIDACNCYVCHAGEKHIPGDLLELEKSIWDFSVTIGNEEISKKYNSISLASCKNPYEEAEYIALKILEYKNSGYKYSEMAVIPRDAEAKKGIINAVFDKYSIPYFYSEKTDLSTSSVARLISSSLKCVSYGYKLDDILTLVKTGLCNISSDECDMFEDYCLTWNISGSLFREAQWSMNADGYTTRTSERGNLIRASANKVKDTIIPPLLTLQQNIHSANKNVKAICSAIYEYLEEIELYRSLSSLCELELSLQNVREAGEILRMYDYVIDSLVQLSLILGDEEMSIDEIRCALDILLSHTDLGSVPAFSDYVTVGSASTLRVENAKIVFIPGIVEGEFPQNISNRGIIKDSDKELLEVCGITLPSSAKKLSADELSYVHRAISKPQEKLILTKYEADIGGQSKFPSIVWNRVLFLLPGLKDKVEKFDLERIKLICREELREILKENTPKEILDEIEYDSQIAASYTPDGEQYDILSTFGKEDSEKEKDMESISPTLARLVFGDSIYLSKSKISTFMLCPYRYWCENVLSLREQKSGQMNVADIGTYVHFVLEKLIGGAHNKVDGSLKRLTKKEILDGINTVSEDFIETIGFIPSPSMLYEISRYRNIAYAMLTSIFEEFENSKFKILATEQKLSQTKIGSLRPMQINLDVSDDFKSKIILTGDIDRIDAYENENGIYVRIVDYKTGQNTFSIDRVSEGNELQLPVYLFSAASDENKLHPIFQNKDSKPIYPASAMFLSSKEESGKITTFRSGFMLSNEEILRAASEKLDQKVILGIKQDEKTGEFVGKGGITEEGIAQMKQTLINTVSDVAKNLYFGKAERCPSSDACKYCKVRSTCPVAAKISKY